MKPYERFIERMLEANRLTQQRDPGAATEVIQEALRAAGLLTEPAAAGHFAQAAGTAGPAGATPGQSARNDSFIDLNPPPAWARKSPRQATAKSAMDAFARMRPNRSVPVRAYVADPLAPGQFLSGSHSGTAGERQYKLYVPAAAATGPRPLIVMLHGCQQNADDFANGTAMNRLAEQHGCLVLYPEQQRKANGSNCWNWFEQRHQRQGEGEPAILAGMTRQVIKEYGADAGRVYVAGLSAGAAMAAVLGSAYPDVFAAVGAHSGLPAGCARDLPSALNAMKGTRIASPKPGVRGSLPVIVFHGDQDHVVHPSNGNAVLDQFMSDVAAGDIDRSETQAGGRGVTRTCVVKEGKVLAEHWVLHGAGHAWSGGRSSGSYTDAKGPDASAEMLRFFLAQPVHAGARGAA